MNLRRIAQPGALALVAALALAGCSSDAADAAGDPSAAADPTAAPDAQGAAGTGGGDAGGVSGLVAAVADGVAQVQEADSQTAVTWSTSTEFWREATVTLDAVTVGSCVVAILPDEDAGTAAATSVAVSAAVDGECTAGPGGAVGGGPSGGGPSGGAPMAPPDGAAVPGEGELPELPEGVPPGAAGGFGSIVAGRVTAVDGTTLTVETAGVDGATTSTTVETAGDTVVTSTLEADASALVVGVCADVRGEADTSGGMAASRITVSDAGDDGCSPRGFGAMPGGGFPGTPGGDATDE